MYFDRKISMVFQLHNICHRNIPISFDFENFSVKLEDYISLDEEPNKADLEKLQNYVQSGIVEKNLTELEKCSIELREFIKSEFTTDEILESISELKKRSC